MSPITVPCPFCDGTGRWPDRRRKLTLDQEDVIVALRRKGWKIKALAKNFGVSESTICRIGREAGIRREAA